MIIKIVKKIVWNNFGKEKFETLVKYSENLKFKNILEYSRILSCPILSFKLWSSRYKCHHKFVNIMFKITFRKHSHITVCQKKIAHIFPRKSNENNNKSSPTHTKCHSTQRAFSRSLLPTRENKAQRNESLIFHEPIGKVLKTFRLLRSLWPPASSGFFFSLFF